MTGQAAKSCRCLEGEFFYKDLEERYLGMDQHFGEVSLETCKLCGQHWLKYAYENEAFTASGRWYRAPINSGLTSHITSASAKDIIEHMPWYYAGGSYFSGKIHKHSGSLHLSP